VGERLKTVGVLLTCIGFIGDVDGDKGHSIRRRQDAKQVRCYNSPRGYHHGQKQGPEDSRTGKEAEEGGQLGSTLGARGIQASNFVIMLQVE
jgi:hypothetical protein